MRYRVAFQFHSRAAFVPSGTILFRYVSIDNFEPVSFQFFNRTTRPYVSRQVLLETRRKPLQFPEPATRRNICERRAET